MAIRHILAWPDQRLRTVAEPVRDWSPELKRLIVDLFDTMYDDHGVGLAATQIGVAQRVIVLDCGLDEPNPIAMINPVIENREGTTTFAEGCLSVPGVRAEIDRSETVTVRFQDADGETQTLDASALMAICIQHEIDHLNGKLYFDHLGPLEQRAFLKAYTDAREGNES